MTLDLAKVRADVKIRGMDIGLFRGVWPLDGWDYRRKVTITEQSGNDLTDYQVLVELDSSNFDFTHAQSNGEDVRFTDIEANLLDYWIEEWDSVAESAKIWVKVPYILANSTTEIYMYYGNPSASSESDASATFIRVIDGLVGSWHLDEGSGDIAYDSSGNNNDGTLINSPQWVDGKFGKALEFNGVTNYVNVPDDDTLDITDEITLEIWMKPDVAQSGEVNQPVGKHCYVLNYDHPDPAFRGSIGIKSGDTWYNSGGPLSISSGEWHHFVGVYDGTYLKTYLDGVEELSNNIGSVTINVETSSFMIGANPYENSESPENYFDGVVDEVRVYNKSLNGEEISDLYNNYGYTTENYPGKVLVRKYTSPEPSVSVGEEETS